MENNHQHVAFLHTELSQTEEDLYLIDAAIALEKLGHAVTIYTASCDDFNGFDPMHTIRAHMRVIVCGEWIPKSIFGTCTDLMNKIRSLWIALNVVAFPPNPKPKAVILDTDASALLILSWFGSYYTIYIHHFPQLKNFKIKRDFLTAKAIGFAKKIVVQTGSLLQVFEKSFPSNISEKITVLCPTYNFKNGTEQKINIRNIVPELTSDRIIFVTFGSYTKRSNFRLLLQSIDYLYTTMDAVFRNKIHLVIAGNIDEGSESEEGHYRNLVLNVSLQPYASQITFLKKVSNLCKEALIQACTAVLHPIIDDVFTGPVMAAMKMGRPIVAVNGGFAKEILVNNVSAMLVEPTLFDFARAMQLLAEKRSVGKFMGTMARENFERCFSFDIFCKKCDNLVLKKKTQECIKNPSKDYMKYM